MKHLFQFMRDLFDLLVFSFQILFYHLYRNFYIFLVYYPYIFLKKFFIYPSFSTIPNKDPGKHIRTIKLCQQKACYPIDSNIHLIPQNKYFNVIYLWKEFSVYLMFFYGILVSVIYYPFDKTTRLSQRFLSFLITFLQIPNEIPRVTDINLYLKVFGFELFELLSLKEKKKYVDSGFILSSEMDNEIIVIDAQYLKNINGTGLLIFFRKENNLLRVFNVVLTNQENIYVITPNFYSINSVLKSINVKQVWQTTLQYLSTELSVLSSLLHHEYVINNTISPNIFMHLRREVFINHTISKFFNIFFENQYLTQHTFNQLGLSNKDTNQTLQNLLGNYKTIFTFSNQEIPLLTKFYNDKYGWSLVDFNTSMKRLTFLDTVEYPLIFHLKRVYEIFYINIEKFVNTVYAIDDDLFNDYEIQLWFEKIKNDIPMFPNLNRQNLINVLVNISFSQSVRHSYAHTHNYYLYNLYDYPARIPHWNLFFQQLYKNQITNSDKEVMFTRGEIYDNVSTLLLPTIPHTLLGYGNDKVFKETEYQSILNKFKNSYWTYVKQQPLNIYTRFLYDAQQNNTV
jgi:hypothetical protein